MLQLIVVKGPKLVGTVFSLKEGASTVIGRSDEVEIVLRSGGVSKQHCRLTVMSGSRVEVQDMNSSNGTFVNGLLVKKHVARPGDIITLHEFALQLRNQAQEAPRVQNLNIGNADYPQMMSDSIAVDTKATPAPEVKNVSEKVRNLLTKNFFPLADSLAERFDLRLLVVCFFLLWSVLLVALTASPFMNRANERVQEQSAAVASLYARQLVRLNQQAIVDQRYNDLIVKLDARIGDTRGLISATILDAANNQILAPSEFLGKSLPTQEAVIAARQDRDFIQYVTKDGVDLAYASSPIKIGTAEGNKTVAVAFVEFNTMGGQFTLAALVNQIVDSVLMATILSLFFLVFLYRWLEGSLLRMSDSIDVALQKGDSLVTSVVQWPALTRLAENVSSALGRAASGGGRVTVSEGLLQDWAISVTEASGTASAAFSSELSVVAWNQKMEQLIGIRANLAIGQDISNASRDIAFETAVRELSIESKLLPWTKQGREIEFSGNPYKIFMIFGEGVFWVNIIPGGEG